jgi:phosphoserine phosphatase
MKKIIAFDCDSTLSAIEGVDELARLAGDEIFCQVEDLTNQAMDGKIAIEDVFGSRLELIRPTREQCTQIGLMYLEKIEPTAKDAISKLQNEGWECLIISGGFAPCIELLAKELNISIVEAVPLDFHPDGSYAGFDESYPTTRNGGKPEIMDRLSKDYTPDKLVMVGDGVSDLETTPVVDLFIAFTRYVARPRVVENCMHEAKSLAEILDILKDR